MTPLGPPDAPAGPVGLPTVAADTLDGMGQADPSPEAAASDIMELMRQLGG